MPWRSHATRSGRDRHGRRRFLGRPDGFERLIHKIFGTQSLVNCIKSMNKPTTYLLVEVH